MAQMTLERMLQEISTLQPAEILRVQQALQAQLTPTGYSPAEERMLQEMRQERGLRPGDELALVEVAAGLLVSPGGSDPETAAWWQSLSDAERRQAVVQARRYEALSGAERDTIWHANAESIAMDAEGDELDLPATSCPA